MEAQGDLQDENAINCLQKWFEDNKKLPNKIDLIYLTRFYYQASRNMDECKRLLELNYSIRHNSPNIYEERDPNSLDTHNTASYVDMLQLPGITADRNRVELARLKNSDPTLVNFTKDVSYYIMISDSRSCQPDAVIADRPLLAEGLIQIIDMKGFCLKHLTRISIGSLQSIVKYSQQAYPLTIKRLHFLNCPSYMSKVLAMVRPFLTKEMSEKMHFHTDGLDSLYEYVPREMLPEEYGGTAGTVSVLSGQVQKAIRDKRDYLMDPKYWMIDN